MHNTLVTNAVFGAKVKEDSCACCANVTILQSGEPKAMILSRIFGITDSG